MSRALVLGGGGPVGIAWECGLIAGLAQGGVDLGAADFILGTSAGSFVGARLAMGQAAAELAAPILREAERATAAPQSDRPPPDLGFLFEKMTEARTSLRDPAETRAEIGRWALEQPTLSEDQFIASFGRSFAGLPDDYWPERDYACTAVDAESGRFQLWTRASRVGLTRAVASSCSVPGVFPPVTLNGRRYIDGGMRSATTADLATGHELVVLVALRIEGGGAQVDDEMASLQDGGATVVLLIPDDASQKAFGPNLMDARRRPDAVHAGLAQGAALAAEMRPHWA
jgi:NTE family protein